MAVVYHGSATRDVRLNKSQAQGGDCLGADEPKAGYAKIAWVRTRASGVYLAAWMRELSRQCGRLERERRVQVARSWVERRLLRVWRRLPGWLQGAVQRLLLPKHLVGAIAVIVDGKGQVLLFNHTYREAFSWGFPGGWLKAGEDPIDALEREVHEESGYRIRALHPLVIGGDRDLRRLDLIFLCTLAGGAFRPSPEVSEASFFPLSALPGLVEPFHEQVAAYASRVLAGEVYGQPPRSPDLARATELERG